MMLPVRRGLWWRSVAVGAVVACGGLGVGAGQAAASGVVSGFTVTPASGQAGGSADVAIDLSFDYTGQPSGDTVKDVAVTFPPGLLASVVDVPALCSTAQLNADTCPAGSQIGTGSVTVSGTRHDAALYLMPPPTSSDVAGLGAVVSALVSVAGMGAFDLVPDASGQPVLEAKITVPTTTPSLRVSELDATLNGMTADGKALMRLPTGCSTASSSVAVDTVDAATGSGTTSFTPTGCASLGYSPSLSAVRVIRDAGDSGAEIIASISQPNAATESATSALEFDLPSSLSANAEPDAACLAGTPCTIGTASASSPMTSSSSLRAGTVTLGGSLLAPTLTVAFPAPTSFSLVGAINLATRVVTFANAPDVPLTALTLDITGPPGAKAFTTSCAAGNVVAKFTPQSAGPAVTSTQPIAYGNCPASGPAPTPTPGPKPPPTVTPKPPTVLGSIAGLPKRHPKLHLTIRHGADAPNVASVAVELSDGLRFRKCIKARTKHTCNGVSVSGAKVKTVTLRGGRLMIVLARPTANASVMIAGPLLTESKSLQDKVRNHKVKRLRITIKVVDANHRTTTRELKLKA